MSEFETEAPVKEEENLLHDGLRKILDGTLNKNNVKVIESGQEAEKRKIVLFLRKDQTIVGEIQRLFKQLKHVPLDEEIIKHLG